MQYGALGIETDVLYQWKNLVPTLIRKLTPISDIYLENIKAKSGQFVSRILGQPELPIQNVHLKNVSVEQLQGDKKHIQENTNNFESDN
jgi:hypothetical protein